MSVTGDNRGVTTVVGAILIFAIVVIGFSIHQAEVVPGQNKKVEFQHYENVQGNLQGVRNSILVVADDNGPETARVRLGTRYPSRLIAVQPPPATGRLRTETIGSGEIAISGVNDTALCGLGHPTTTKSLVYSPDYYYLDGTPPVTYENTVIYRRAEDGDVLLESGQILVSGSTISLAPVIGSYSKSGSQSVTLDFHGSETGSTVVSGPQTLTIPTKLEPQQWEDLLNHSTDNVKDVATNTSRESAVDIEFAAGTYLVRCTPVGVNENPGGNPTLDAGADGKQVNPAEPGSVVLEEETQSSGNHDHVVNLVLNNTGATDVTIDRARINFYQDSDGSGGAPGNPGGGGGNAPAYAELRAPNGTVTATLTFGDPYESLSPGISLPNQTDATVSLAFYTSNGNEANIKSSDWFVVSFDFSDAKSETYLIGVPK